MAPCDSPTPQAASVAGKATTPRKEEGKMAVAEEEEAAELESNLVVVAVPPSPSL